MKTMTQPPESDNDSRYDIDMGVVFAESDSKTPKTTKGWVRDAIAKKATNLKNEPKAKPKCVRVEYADGYQVDFPVFRKRTTGGGEAFELAAGDLWVGSNPKAINDWFEEVVRYQSPEEDGGYQLRRIARFIKYFAKVHSYRRNLKFPAGLVAAALAVECYQPVAERDDEALYRTLHQLSLRSEFQPVFANGTQISDHKDVDRIKRLVEDAKAAISALDAIRGDEQGLADADARKAWRKVFRHSYFDESVAKVDDSGMEYKSALLKGALAAPMIASSALAGLSEDETARRREAAIESIRETGRGSKPWAK